MLPALVFLRGPGLLTSVMGRALNFARGLVNRPFPLPEDLGLKRARASTYVVRAAAAHLRALVTHRTPERAAKELFGDDPATEIVLKASSSPAAMTQTGWAAELAQHGVRDLVASVTSISAGAVLIGRGLQIDMDGYAQLRIPGRVLDVNSAGQWVAEGAPVPVRQIVTTQGAVLQPHKLIVLTSFSRELAEHSLIEGILRQTLSEAVGLALDAALFSATADDGVHPGGLFYNVTPVAAAGRLQRDIDTAAQDIANLTADLASRGAGLSPVLICNVKQAMMLKLMAGPQFDVPVLPSATLAAGTVVMVEPSSFVSAFSPVPEFSTSTAAALHMEDTAPQNITSGSPSKSMFQIDSVALQMRLRAGWGLRAPHVSYLTGANWP